MTLTFSPLFLLFLYPLCLSRKPSLTAHSATFGSNKAADKMYDFWPGLCLITQTVASPFVSGSQGENSDGGVIWKQLGAGETLTSFPFSFLSIYSLRLFYPPSVTFTIFIFLFSFTLSPLFLSLFLSHIPSLPLSCAYTHKRDTHLSSLFLFWITPLLLVWVFSLLPALNREGRWDSKELPGAQFAQRFDVIEMLCEQTHTHTLTRHLYITRQHNRHPPTSTPHSRSFPCTYKHALRSWLQQHHTWMLGAFPSFSLFVASLFSSIWPMATFTPSSPLCHEQGTVFATVWSERGLKRKGPEPPQTLDNVVIALSLFWISSWRINWHNGALHTLWFSSVIPIG